VLLVMEDSIVSPAAEVDQLGVLANLQALTGLCTDISTRIHVLYSMNENTNTHPSDTNRGRLQPHNAGHG
jgi:hypothetical protein